MATLSTIKNWFRTGLKPTQTQFWSTWDSFWHKDEKIPQTSIEGLQDSFDEKADAQSLHAVAISGSYNDLEDVPSKYESTTILKHPDNSGVALEINDGIIGFVQDVFLDGAIYIGDDPELLSSYIVQASNTNPCENEYVDIDEMLADQANQNSGFYQYVEAGNAIYYYNGSETSTIADYVELSNTDGSEKADKTTKITAGAGLIGGGTLEGDRTFEVKFGTTAGTVAKGNDSRFIKGAENGVIIEDGVIGLGGSIEKSESIIVYPGQFLLFRGFYDNTAFFMIHGSEDAFNGLGKIQLGLQNAHSGLKKGFNIFTDHFYFKSDDGKGIEYNDDYKVDYTDRSLVDKGYVDYREGRKEVKTISETAYTLLKEDVNFILVFTSDTPITVTINYNGMPSLSRFEGKQRGHGQISFVAGDYVTINTPPSTLNKTAGKFSPFAIDALTSYQFDLYGNLELE